MEDIWFGGVQEKKGKLWGALNKRQLEECSGSSVVSREAGEGEGVPPSYITPQGGGGTGKEEPVGLDLTF